MLKKLSRKWIVAGFIIVSLLLGGTIAYAASAIIVDFGSSVGVEGQVIIVAPEPTINDIVVTSPTFTITYGDTTEVTANMMVQNLSAYDLTLVNVTISMDNTDVAALSLGSFIPGVHSDLLPAGSAHLIPITMAPWGTQVSLGSYSYSGTIEYSYQEP